MRSYTDLNQSRKLAEILPLESADMSYRPYRKEGGIPDYETTLLPFRYASWIGIPCWSLATLFNILPSVIKRKEKRMFLTLEKAGAYNLYYKSPDRLDELWETKEDLVDACVGMILNLHELKML